MLDDCWVSNNVLLDTSCGKKPLAVVLLWSGGNVEGVLHQCSSGRQRGRFKQCASGSADRHLRCVENVRRCQ